MRAVQIIRGNALALPLADVSVDLICTSPPYFGLRSYTDAGQHYAGQLGSEATPAEFVDALIAATREMMRVLKPSGSAVIEGRRFIGVELVEHYAEVAERRIRTAAGQAIRVGQEPLLDFGGVA